jgi:hypothetical protein
MEASTPRRATLPVIDCAPVHETPADLEILDELLERSHAAGGRHLRSIITWERRIGARELAQRLDGMRLLVLATSTADGRPIAAPVDGIFYRGAFHFGSAPDSLRFRHIAERPAVSAVHAPAESFAVSVHGRALRLDVAAPEHAGFRATLLEIYTPRYGPGWEHDFLDSPGVAYARIEAERMFTFSA